MREAEKEGRDYEPVTERGRAVHGARQARAMLRELRARVEQARETYGAEREAGQGRVSAGLAALRVAAEKDRGRESDGQAQEQGDIRDRLSRIVGREAGEETPERETPAQGRESVRDRLGAIQRTSARSTRRASAVIVTGGRKGRCEANFLGRLRVDVVQHSAHYPKEYFKLFVWYILHEISLMGHRCLNNI